MLTIGSLQMLPRLKKLRGAFGAYKQKVRVVVLRPRIFHGISASVLGLKHFAELRTEFMRAVDFFSVQRLLAFARSFNTPSCMLHRTGKLSN